MSMSFFRRFVLGMTALLMAFRLLFPVQHAGTSRTDLITTILHEFGILIIGAALFLLAPAAAAPRPWGSLRRYASGSVLLLAWLFYIVAAGVGLKLYGIATSGESINWFATALVISVSSLLAWSTWLWLRSRTSVDSLATRTHIITFIIVVTSALVSVGGWFAQQRQRYEFEVFRYHVIEGERFGVLRLGISLEDVKWRLGSFSSANRESDVVVRYVFPDADGSWQVFFDTTTSRAVAIMYFPQLGFTLDEAYANREKVKFETNRGAKYNHDAGTIEAIYGVPGHIYRLSPSIVTYYYPAIRTEFLFVCHSALPKPGQQSCPFYALEQIRLYAGQWSPERLWGAKYGSYK